MNNILTAPLGIDESLQDIQILLHEEVSIEFTEEILNSISYNRFKITGVERRIENIFREFSSKELKYENMNKHHVFSINITLNYTIANKSN